MRNLISFSLAVGLTCLASGASAQTQLDMASEYEANSLHGKGDALFVKRVEELSGGAIVITLHSGGSLGLRSADNLDAVSDGVVAIAGTISGVLAGSEPIFELSSLPFLAPTSSDARMLYQKSKPEFERFFEANDQIFLYASPWPPSGIFADKPIDSVDALKGLKIRTYDANGTRTMIAADAAPIQLSWADTVPQLATGGINAVLTSAEGGVLGKFWEHLKAFTRLNYAMPLHIVHMNRDAYESLAPEAQDALRTAASEAEDNGWAAVDERMRFNYKRLEEENMSILLDPPDAVKDHLRAAGSKVLDEWRKKAGPEAEKVLKAYGQAVGQTY